MQSLFFGESERPLFGIYQPPAARADRGRGVVLVNPMGQEYLPAYPSTKQLGGMLASEGFHVLRFDFSGTGDSSGEFGSGDCHVWTREVGLALDELADLGQIDRLSLIGLRLGGALAAQAGAARRGLEQVVLWDTVVRGSDYLAELRGAQQDYLASVLPRPEDAIRDGATDQEVLGYPLRPALCTSLTELDLLRLGAAPAPDMLLINREDTPSARELEAHLVAQGVRVERATIAGPRIWQKPATVEQSLVHPKTLQTIVAWIRDAGRR